MPSSSIINITINYDKKCIECGKKGATENGLCLNCINKAIKGKPMKTTIGQVIAKKFKRGI